MRYLLLILSVLTVLAFENCGSPGNGGQSAFNITSASTGTNGGNNIPLSSSAISLSSLSYPVGASFNPSVTVSGTNLNSVMCTWTIYNSSNSPVGTSVAQSATLNGSFCSAPLVAPSSAGTYILFVSVANGGGELAKSQVTFTVTASAPPPTPTPVATPPPPTPTPVATPPPPTPSPTPILDPCPRCGCPRC